jgi:hypothetical protein
MPEIRVDVEIYCSCGEGLCRQSDAGNTRGRGTPYITVSPCEKCLEKAKDDGRDKGYSDGYSDGYKDKEKELTTEG